MNDSDSVPTDRPDLDAIETYARDAGPGTIQTAAAAHLLRRSVPALVAENRELRGRVSDLSATIQRVRALIAEEVASIQDDDSRTLSDVVTARVVDLLSRIDALAALDGEA